MKSIITKFKVILYILILAAGIINDVSGQACSGSEVTIFIVDAKRISATKFTFELWLENTGTNTERISAFGGGIFPNVALGAGYTMTVLEQPVSLGWTLNNFVPNVTQTSNMRWTNNPLPSSTSYIGDLAKIAKFEVTTSIMPTSLTFATSGTQPVIISYSCENPSSNSLSTANGNLVYANGNAPVLIENFTLPIELEDFAVQKLGQLSSILNWGTTTETNSSHFGIERSLNGYRWETIGRVAAAGTSRVEKAYRFFDDQLPRFTSSEQEVYYRLKLCDQDGRYQYSEIRSVLFERNEGFIQVYPNPATQKLYIDLSGIDHNGEDMELTIIGMDGSLVMRKTFRASDKEPVEVDQLPANTYQILVKHGDQVYQQRMVKVD